MAKRSKIGKSVRFKERYDEAHTLSGIQRFEALPSSHHIRNALSLIVRIRQDGVAYFGKNLGQIQSWEEHCNLLYAFLNQDLSQRKYKGQDLAKALREYIHEFEHVSYRLHEMLYGPAFKQGDSKTVLELSTRMKLLYRHSTYAILAFWIDDKTEDVVIRVKTNLATGKTRSSIETKGMKIPGKYHNRDKYPGSRAFRI